MDEFHVSDRFKKGTGQVHLIETVMFGVNVHVFEEFLFGFGFAFPFLRFFFDVVVL